MELTITKEKVLEAASKCEVAKATLKVLFPEVFAPEVDLSKVKFNNAYGMPGLSVGEDHMIWVGHDLSDRFLLDDSFEWELKNSGRGYLELIPTRQKD